MTTTKWKTKRMVPCGKCARCRQNRRMGWFVRLREEMMNHLDNHWLTLTYSNDNLPTNGVQKRDVQLWLKRVRKKIQPVKIKYYLVGEYGTKTSRPHYHVCIFGTTYQSIEGIWDKGNAYPGRLEEKSIMYTTKYHVNINSKNHPDRNKEFTLSSKGLGISYVNNAKNWHNPQTKAYYPYYDQKLPLPRYYKEKVFNRADREILYMLAKDPDSKLEVLQRYADKHKVTMSDAIEWHIAKEKNFEKNYKHKSNILNKF